MNVMNNRLIVEQIIIIGTEKKIIFIFEMINYLVCDIHDCIICIGKYKHVYSNVIK